MSERIPTADDIRQALRLDGWTHDEANEGIDRIKAAAWDEGYAVGQTDHDCDATNPYREEEGL